jgi:hypothetical protein
MALSIENVATNQGTGTTLDVTLTITSGNLLVIGVGYVEGAPATSGVVWDPAGANQALTQLIRIREAADTGRVSELWYRKAPTPGASKIIQITFTASAGAGSCALGFIDADQTTTFGTAVSAVSPGGGSDPITVTAGTAAGEIIVDFVTGGSNSTAGADQTQRYHNVDLGALFACSTQNGADGGVMSWTRDGGSTQSWAQTAVSIKPTGGGGGSTASPDAGALVLSGTVTVLASTILMPSEA